MVTPSVCVSFSLFQTEEYMDNLDFPMAKMFCQRALDIEPTNVAILDMLGNICAELGDIDKAKQISFPSGVHGDAPE